MAAACARAARVTSTRGGQRAEEKRGAWRAQKSDWRGERIEGSMFLSMSQHTCSVARSLSVLRPKIVTAGEENDPMVEE